VRTRWIVAAALALMLAGGACGGGTVDTTGPTTTGAPTGEPSPEPTGGTTGATGPTGPSVTLVNFMFDPDRIDAAPGSTIALRNTNPSTPHTFTVEDIDVTLDPMSSTEVTVDLGPGEYDVICRFHEGQGMTATLVVESI